MDCDLCRRSQADHETGVSCKGIESVEECPKKQVPKVLEENEGFLEIFNRMVPGLYDGTGSLKIEAVRAVCDVWDVPAGERPVILDKVLVCNVAIREIRAAEKNRGSAA